MLARNMEQMGCKAMAAENGWQAIEMMRSQPFDLLLLDIMMPEIDGYEVLATLRKDPVLRRIPVIMISAMDDSKNVVRCIEMGAKDYMLKPINSALLKTKVKALLERKRQRDLEPEKYGDILVVDVHKREGLNLARMLEQLGHTAIYAENGRKALEILRTPSYDIVMIEMGTPETEGEMLLDHLKRDLALNKISIIAMSSAEAAETVMKGIKMGLSNYLVTPIDATILKSRIDAVLQKEQQPKQGAGPS